MQRTYHPSIQCFRAASIVCLASMLTFLVSCTTGWTSENENGTGQVQPDWVQGLREPLHDLPPEPVEQQFDRAVGSPSGFRVGKPSELGHRITESATGKRTPVSTAAQGPGSSQGSSGGSSSHQINLTIDGLRGAPGTNSEPVSVPVEPSALERQYRGQLPSRPDRDLEQFGYGALDRLGPTIGAIESDAADDHVLNVGDELIIDLTTDRVERIRARVQADGTIELVGLASVRVAGLRFLEANEAIERAISRTRRGFELSVGLGRLASVPVRVVGEVARPGVIEAGPRPTLLDAISLTGMLRSGSLRRVTITRTDGSREEIDLYDYLLGDTAKADVRLFRGDSVTVVPIGPTAAIAGSVQRPAIYELADDDGLSVLEAIDLSGGWTGFAVTNQVQIERTEGSGRVLLDVDPSRSESRLRDGDLLLVGAVDGRLHPIVEVRGEVARPGRFQHREGLSVGDLVRMSGGLTIDAFERQALLSRVSGPRTKVDGAWDAGDISTARRVMVIDLAKAATGDPEHDVALEPLDMLRVQRSSEAVVTPTVELIGAARRPGVYELTAGMSVSDLLSIGGNLQPDAFREEAELVRRRRSDDATLLDISRYRINLADILRGDSRGPTLSSGDRVIIRRMTRAEVRVRADGRVRFPGEYVLPAGSRISDLIAAAGGLLGDSDLRAAWFTRRSVRDLQLSRWEGLAERTRETYERNLEQRVNSARSKEAFSARIQLEQVQDTLARLRSSQANGRIVLPFMDEGFLDSTANLVLEDADTLRVPRLSSTIAIQGHVFNPLTVVYESGLSAEQLLERAGGLTEVADRDRLYVVRADGRVASVAQRGGRFRLDAPLQSGDVVLVPPRPLGRDAGSVMLDILLLARSAGEAGALWNIATSSIDDASVSIVDTPASPRSDSTPPAELLREFQR